MIIPKLYENTYYRNTPSYRGFSHQQTWIEELEKYPEQYTIHQLYKAYPDEHIDVKEEQQLIEQYDYIVFQFPLYWFSSPPLLKKWQDEVLTYGWAYGSKSGYKVGGKKVTLAISAGIDVNEYAHNEKI